jgi:predicted kinase
VNESKKIILLVGPPGSGKSTLAKSYIDMGYIYINQDLQGVDHFHHFDMAILNSDNIIIDRMNFNKEQRNRYLNIAKDNNYKTEIIVLHESRKTCLERCLNRKDHPTIKDEKSARSALQTFFNKYERVEDNEVDKVTRIWPEGFKEMAIWIDMDNTLSDASHREHHLQGEKKNWKAFFGDMDKDPVNLWCKQIIVGMFDDVNVLICSARPDNYRKQTEEWLNNNDVPYKELIMRSRGDFRKDSIVKEILFEFEIKTKYNLLFSIDDRKQVIDQIRKHGVVVLDCAGEKGHF